MNIKMNLLLISVGILFAGNSISQVGIGTTTPVSSAELDVTSTTKGFLPPRMTHAQKIAIVSPVAGLEIWCTNCGAFGETQLYNGTTWTNAIGGTASFPLPSVTTTAASAVLSTTATSGGNVTSDGGSAVTARGVCWSTTTNPTTALVTKTIDAGTTGTFTSSITGLSASTIYYIRAYASNITGTTYGNEISITTSIPQPAYPAGTVNCGFVTTVIEITSPAGRVWMDRNLGAATVATSSADANAFGDLYQWGRRADGHQCRNLANVTSGALNTDTPCHGMFIQTNSSPYDWRSPQSTSLWQGLSGTNNPCPTGYRLPTQTEWQAEINAIGAANMNIEGFYTSTLKLTAAHRRNCTNNSWNTSLGSYWSSTLNGTWARGFTIVTSGGPAGNSYMWDDYRANGYSVRCIKHQ